MYYFEENGYDYPNNEPYSYPSVDNNTPQNPNNKPNLPIPKLKEVVAQTTLSENNLTLTSSDGRIKMTAAATSLDGDTKAKIQRVEVDSHDPNITLRGYDFSIGKGGEMGGVIKIEMPYSQDDIASGYTLEQSVSALQYNEKEHVYEPVHHAFDKNKQKLVISTTHLSKIDRKSVV